MTNPRQPQPDQFAIYQTVAPRVPFDDFMAQLAWKQGEHFALIGPIGQGKTEMLTNLLPLHPYVTIVVTKPVDPVMSGMLGVWWRRWLSKNEYRRWTKWRSQSPDTSPHRILWPKSRNLATAVAAQKKVISDALDAIYMEGGWTVAVDELWYICNVLNMTEKIRLYLLTVRTLGVSLLMATQRPAWVPLEVYDMSTHLMFWRDNDERNLARISGVSVHNSAVIRSIVSNLEPHQVLYVNTRTGQMLRTRIPAAWIRSKAGS